MSEEFIGAGWSFHLRIDAGGGIALSTGDQEIEEAIELVLRTAPGERPMRPEFGCGIHDFVFAPMDTTTAGRIAHEVRRSLERWEPRIEVQDILVAPREDPGGAFLDIDIRYTVRGTYDPRSLVFPFYIIPREEVTA